MSASRNGWDRGRTARPALRRGRPNLAIQWGSAVAAAALLVACSSSDDDAASDVSLATPVFEVTVAEDGFCDIMIQIRVDALNGDAAPDPDVLADRYREALATAPAEIRPDLQSVIVGLDPGAQFDTQTSTAATPSTSALEPDDPGDQIADADEAGDGWQPAATPGERLVEFVESHCSGTASNPGPAATPPP